MSTVAMEAALAELNAWRREAERKIARLEAELTHVRSGATAGGASDRAERPRQATLPLQLQSDRPGSGPTVTTGLPAPAGFAPTPFQGATTLASAEQEMPATRSTYPTSLGIGSVPPPAIEVRPTYPPPIVARPLTERPQYNLELRPGESVDIPDEFNGGRKKRRLGWAFGVALVLGMAALIITALASQR